MYTYDRATEPEKGLFWGRYDHICSPKTPLDMISDHTGPAGENPAFPGLSAC